MKCMSSNVIKTAADMNVNLIPAPYDELYKVLGFEGFKILFEYFGSRYLYIPSMRNILSDCIKTQAIKDFESRAGSFDDVARKYGYTSRYLRKMLERK